MKAGVVNQAATWQGGLLVHDTNARSSEAEPPTPEANEGIIGSN
jgi:hypothetical protein